MPKRRTKSVPAPRRSTERRAAPPGPKQPTRWALAKRRAGWPLSAVGAAAFVVSNIASRAGVQVLPFDHHHIIGQFGGFALLITGLIWATKGPA